MHKKTRRLKHQKRDSTNLHLNNAHRNGYDFEKLCLSEPQLEAHVFKNKYGNLTIDFANPKAVKSLNSAIFHVHYGIDFWEFPDENLCPPIPGRVDYLHHLKDLIGSESNLNPLYILDIGTGATCIYPILGTALFNWHFVATDIDKSSIQNAQVIVERNGLSTSIDLRRQHNPDKMFEGILNPHEKFNASMCNPPFYSSQSEAVQANLRKLKGLGLETTQRNFSGTQNELWYPGGEKAFIHNYLYQSSKVKNQCFWFTTLVSKKEHVDGIYKSLSKLGATQIEMIPMLQGNKITRIMAWTFLSKSEQNQWM